MREVESRHTSLEPRQIPTRDEIGAALERVLASSDFSVSKRCRDFLCYIVKETIAGRADRIKAYSIAIEVFGRDERFSPDDPVVRIEAGRLRRALERYYLLSGKRDLVRIDIPKGAYVPNFNFGRSEPKSRAVQPDALRTTPPACDQALLRSR